ncbi:c-type cytochrome [Flavihumibacter sp. CACIAM 22H1]|uniref:c-type cytochrome n=1 Tax=Flavihumibacter sp. CACIAM 22H1 TaxID=1812911 RepID=UPI0007A91C1B|nr:c-type cytochrome [Flavihumibacter sp. CACIAM 22H1]KYP14503.1 MAG: cytochrome C [Flavihumibacter sp. CACIAM 22H1]
MKKLVLLACIAALIYACGSGTEQKDQPADAPAGSADASAAPADNPDGVGKFKNVQIPEKLDAAMAQKGESVYDVKCSSCHKLTDEKLVGPGWKGVTQRNSAAWIMNFVTNVDEMLNTDPKAQAQLEICLVRMPNQNLTDEDARHIYEFMRKNDGVQ